MTKRTGGWKIVRETYPQPERPYTVDHYDEHGNHIAELGRYPDLDSARVAFAAAVKDRPQRCLCLRRDARVIARHEPGQAGL